LGVGASTAPYDLKLRILVLCHVYGYSINKIYEVLGIRKSLVCKTFYLYTTLSDVASPVVAVSITRTSLTSNHAAIFTALHS